VALMLRHSLGCEPEADALEKCVFDCWKDGVLTTDLRPDGFTTSEVTDAVCQRLGGASLT